MCRQSKLTGYCIRAITRSTLGFKHETNADIFYIGVCTSQRTKAVPIVETHWLLLFVVTIRRRRQNEGSLNVTADGTYGKYNAS